MAQFRTTTDILDEILQKAGEVANGNSPFETRALTYANKAYHSIIGGGNIFNLNVDEPWVWARSRNPIVLELKPAYTTGQLTVTNGDVNVVFSQAPTNSVEGWHLQLNGKPTVYKVMNHTAAGTAAQIDSSCIDSSGVYNFRAFQLDYQVFPAYLYIDNKNDKLDFVEVGTASSTTLATTLTHGAYTPANYISHVIAKLGNTGTASYGGSYDTVARSFTLTASQTFSLLGATGANVRRSAVPALGFDQLDQTGAKTYTSTYKPNQIARLIEPFKLFTTSPWPKQPFIYSTDPIKMQEDYPVSLTEERIPDRFVRLTEESDGTVWVRFNCYPKDTTKVQCDWIPQPIDLQDNTASVPALPRADVDTLIHAATAFILFDKEDTKWESMVSLTKNGLDAMKTKNHGALFRTGQFFAQQVPRQDLDKQMRRLNYGYLVSGTTAASTTAESVQSLISCILNYTAFATNATQHSVTAATLADNRTLFSLIVKHSTSFTGTGVSAVTLDIGTSANATQFISGFDVHQAVSATAQASAITLYFPAVSTPIVARLTTTGGNTNALSAGSVTVYLQEATNS